MKNGRTTIQIDDELGSRERVILGRGNVSMEHKKIRAFERGWECVCGSAHRGSGAVEG
jgi:hypothetical protein